MVGTNEKRSQWHPACYAALNLEFAENKHDLEFQQELSLNVLPLRVDTLIIKKKRNCIVKNEMGKLFRIHNLVEYKSPDDSLSYNMFLKGIANTLLYKVSEKDDKSSHGYGITSLKLLVEKYDGLISFTQIEDRFVVLMCIPI